MQKQRYEFEVGDTVRLQLGTDFDSVPRGLQRWDGCEFVISKKKRVNGQFLYFELKTCRSEKGVNYSIHEDWLVPTR